MDRADVRSKVEALAAWDLSVSKAERADAFMELYDEAVKDYEDAMTVLNMNVATLERHVDNQRAVIGALERRSDRLRWVELKLVELEDENERLRKLESDSIEVVVDDLHHGKISPARAVERLRRLM